MPCDIVRCAGLLLQRVIQVGGQLNAQSHYSARGLASWALPCQSRGAWSPVAGSPRISCRATRLRRPCGRVRARSRPCLRCVFFFLPWASVEAVGRWADVMCALRVSTWRLAPW